MKAAILAQLLEDRRRKRPVVLAVTLPTGEERLVYPYEPAGDEGEGSAELREAAVRAADRDQCVTLEGADGGQVFVQPFNPPLRLVVVGAVHIAQVLSRLATLVDFEVVVVDPRSAFATEARFPGVTRVIAWPDKGLLELAPDRRTAVVTLTHDPKLDDPGLVVALRSPAFYVGCIGSRKTHASRLARLREQGFGEADLARLFGPVGLRIGALSPAEIAVSILSQIVEQLRLPSTAAPAR